MPNEYIVPLGLDGKKLLGDLDDTIGKIGAVEDKAGEAGKTIEQAFGKGAKAADDLENSLKPTTKSIEDLRTMANKTGADLNNAFKIKEGSTEFSKKITAFRKQLADITGKKTIGLEIDQTAVKDLRDATNYLKNNFEEISSTFVAAGDLLDQNIDSVKAGIMETEGYIKDLKKTLDTIAPGTAQQELITELNAAKTAVNEEKAALADYEAQLQVIDEANKNLAKTLNEATESVEQLEASQSNTTVGLNELGNAEEQVTTKGKSLKAELREIKANLQAMELAGEGGSQKFFDLSVRAGELEDQIGDTNAQIKTLASDSKYLDATVSGVTGLVGAFTLAQGAAGLLGVENEDLEAALLKVNSAMAVLQGLQAVAETLNKDSAFSVIFLRNARVADTVATEAETVATVTQTTATEGATVATKGLSLAFKALGIGLIIGLIAYLVENWDKLSGALKKILPVGFSVGKMFDQIKSIAMGVGNVVLQYLITPFRALTALLSGNLTEFKQVIVDGFNIKKNFTDGYNKQEVANEKAHQKELEEARIKADERDLARRKNRGEDTEKAEIALQKRRLALDDKGSKEYKENLTKLEDLQDKHYKTMSDAQKKAADDAKKKRDDAAKKALEDKKKEDTQTIAYSRAVADIKIAAIGNANEQERAKINEEYKRKQEDATKEAALTTQAKSDLSKLVVLLEEERVRKLAELDKKAAEEKYRLQVEAQTTIADLTKQGTARDLELLRIDHEKRKKDIETNYADEADLRNMLLAALDQSTAREKKRINDEAATKALNDEEERQLLAIEMASKYAKKSEQTERQKQIAILETKIEFAEKGIKALVASGYAENSLEVQRAKSALNALRKELQDDIKENNGKGFDFLEFIGLGGLDDKQKDAVKKAASSVANNLGQITDFIVDQYQRQIDKKQESIDQLDNEIGTLEDSLDEEKELRENGFANNVDIIEAELAEKQRQKDEEVKQQEDLLKKKQSLQKAQMAVDTAIQLVNMITASTEIFKSLAGIPFIGIPLAIATIGTMFGAFAVAKVRAAQSISDQKFGEGGWIDGKSHAEGGKKYYSADGDVRELEKDEFVVRKRQAKKFSNLLEAINNGSFSGFDVNDAGLAEMLSGMGISLNEDSSAKGLREASAMDALKLSVTINNKSNDKEMQEMNDNIRFLAQQERESIKTWEDDKYFYTKKGTRTTRILKTPITTENDTDRT